MLWLDDPDPLVPATGRFVLLYHLLWELTHVCFEHPGLLTEPAECTDEVVHHLLRRGAARRGGRADGRVRTAAGVEDVDDDAGRPGARPATSCSCTRAPRSGGWSRRDADFLYPFLDAEERDQDALLRDLAASAAAKAAESAALRESTLDANRELIATAAAEMARRFAAGGRMFAFGNGGSSTDAATLAALFARPPVGEPLPAWSLAADQAVLTALGNDVGFDLVFARQLIARAGPGDIAVGMSTSGSSRDLMAGFREARARGMFTVGFAGYDGGEFATSPDVDVCLIVRSQSVHRIQEAQALVGYRALDRRAADRLRRPQARALS